MLAIACARDFQIVRVVKVSRLKILFDDVDETLVRFPTRRPNPEGGPGAYLRDHLLNQGRAYLWLLNEYFVRTERDEDYIRVKLRQLFLQLPALLPEDNGRAALVPVNKPSTDGLDLLLQPGADAFGHRVAHEQHRLVLKRERERPIAFSPGCKL